MDSTSPLDNVKPSPRVKLAAQLYATGAARTKREAGEMAGLHPQYLSMLRNNPAVQEIIAGTQMRVSDEAVSASALVQSLAREAIETIAQIMQKSGSDALRLKAAIDIADRAPETSKVQKHAVAAFSLNSMDAKDLARALVEAAGVKRDYASAAESNFVRVEQQLSVGPAELPLKEIQSVQGLEASNDEANQEDDWTNVPVIEVEASGDAE